MTGELTASNDNERDNNRTFSISLEIPGNVTGVATVGIENIILFFYDNDGRSYNNYTFVVSS